MPRVLHVDTSLVADEGNKVLGVFLEGSGPARTQSRTVSGKEVMIR